MGWGIQCGVYVYGLDSIESTQQEGHSHYLKYYLLISLSWKYIMQNKSVWNVKNL